jgi:O-methyltransferase
VQSPEGHEAELLVSVAMSLQFDDIEHSHHPRTSRLFDFVRKNKHVAALCFPYSKILDRLNSNAQLFRFIREHPVKIVEGRQSFHKHLYSNYCPDGEICYLEFGVAEGESLRWWTEFNDDENSRFFGFDTFEGLPENWDLLFSRIDAGTYSTGGKFPSMADPRVTFVKGLFQDTMDAFLEKWKQPKTVIIHLDADLYSSTLYVLARLHNILMKGSILIFDEFCTASDEFRAFQNYVAAFRTPFECVVASTPDYRQLAIATGTLGPHTRSDFRFSSYNDAARRGERDPNAAEIGRALPRLGLNM